MGGGEEIDLGEAVVRPYFVRVLKFVVLGVEANGIVFGGQAGGGQINGGCFCPHPTMMINSIIKYPRQ